MSHHSLPLLFALLIGCFHLLNAAPLPLPEQLADLRKLRHENFEVRAWAAPDTSEFALVVGDLQGDYAVASLQKGEFSLGVKDTATLRTAKLDWDGKQPLIIRRHGIWLEALTPRQRLIRIPTFAKLKGGAHTSLSNGKPAFTKLDYQRLEPFTFGDDFMRTEEEAKQWGLWTPVSGEWKIYSVMERIHENKAARIREGYEPVADRSPNPFCLSAKAPEGEAIIVAGHDFWCDYEASVSVKPFLSVFGLIVGYQDEKNFTRLEWNLPTLGAHAADMKLIQRRDGMDTVLNSATLSGRSETWWRLAIRLYGNQLEVLLDSASVFRATTSQVIGGKIGLYAQGANETFFDDVDVKSITGIALGDEEMATLATKQLHLTTIGTAEWGGQRVETQLLNRKADRRQGLVVGKQQQYAATWTRKQGGRLELHEGGKLLCAIACPWNDNSPLKLAVDTTETGILTVWVNNTLKLRQHVPADAVGGAIGLFADDDDARFAPPVLFASLDRDWEKPVDIARFANDPFMQGWASSRYSWLRQGDAKDQSFPQRHLYTGDFYGAFTLDAPLQPGLNYHFGLDELNPQQGYLLKTQIDTQSLKGTLTLTKAGRVLAQAPFTATAKTVIPGAQIVDEKIGARPRTPDTDSYGKLSFRRDGNVMWASVNGTELFNVLDDKPLTGRAFGVDTPMQMDFIHLEVKRESLKDYLFEKAESDWIQQGRWEVTNRFACDPRWSHMNGESKGAASIWSKFDLEGDYTLECFAGMRMRQGEMLEGARISYPRVGDINVALEGDGHELFSGYNLIVSAWDPHWSEKWTQFWRQDKVVAKSDADLIPRGRFRSPQGRAVQQVWDPGGRPVHGAWYALKIRKTNHRYDVWFDNTPVFSFTDKSPLNAGRRIALWTQYNSIVLARVKVNYRQMSRTAPLAQETAANNRPLNNYRPLPPTHQEALPALKVISAPKLASVVDFTSWNGDQSAEYAPTEGPDKGTTNAMVFRNANSGGDFGANFNLDPMDMMAIAKLEFDFCASKNAFVNLYFTIDDDFLSRYFITLTGPAQDGPNLYNVGSFNFRGGEKWTHVSVDLNQMIHAKYPWRKSWTLKSMMIGMLHEGYLNAGLNGNQRGAWYKLANVKLTPVHSQDVSLLWLVEEGQNPPLYRAWFADSDAPGLAAPATAKALQANKYTFRKAPGQNATHLLVETQDDKKTWKRYLSYPLPQPMDGALTAELVSPKPEKPWGGNPLVLKLQGPREIIPVLDNASLKIGEQAIKLNALNTTYDLSRRQLTIQPNFAAFKTPEKGLVMQFTFADSVNGGHAASWSLAYDAKQDKTAPMPPVVKKSRSALAGYGYAYSEATPYNSRSHVKLDFAPRTSNIPMATVTNTICGTDSGISFLVTPFNPSQYPYLSFDYNIPTPDTYVDLLLEAGQIYTMGMTDCEKRNDNYLGDIPGIVADGKWHHALIPINQISARVSSRNPKQQAQVNRLGIGNWNYSGTQPGSTFAVSNLQLAQIGTTYQKPLALFWSANDPSGIAGYSYEWNPVPDTVPDTVIDTTQETVSFEDLKPGLTYFHIRAVDSNGNWSLASHFMFFIDNSVPQIIASAPQTGTKDAPTQLSFKFNEDSGDLNFNGATLLVNGKSRTIQASNTQYDRNTHELLWNMLSDYSLTGGEIPDGTAFTAKLQGVYNAAGTMAQPLECTWTVDYSQDKTAPETVNLSAGANNAFRLVRHFSDPRQQVWSNSRYAEQRIVKDDLTGSNCLEITQKAGDNRRFLSYIQMGQIKPSESPWLRFRYRIMPKTRVNMYIYLDKSWHTIVMNGSSDTYQVIGTIPGAKDDGQWHVALLDLKEILKTAQPDNANPFFNLVAFGELVNPASNNQLRIDDFAYLAELPPVPLYFASSTDATGIKSFAVDVTQEPGTAKLQELAYKTTRSRFTAPLPDKPGIWFMSVQAKDGAGNLSEIHNFPFVCTQPAVADAKEDGLERLDSERPWRGRAFNPNNKRTYCTVNEARTKSGNHVLTATFSGYQDQNVNFVRRLTKNELGLVSQNMAADLYIDGKDELRISLVALDRQLGVLQESDVLTVKPDGKWQRKLKFALKELPEAPFFIGFHLQVPDKSRNRVIFDNIRPQ